MILDCGTPRQTWPAGPHPLSGRRADEPPALATGSMGEMGNSVCKRSSLRWRSWEQISQIDAQRVARLAHQQRFGRRRLPALSPIFVHCPTKLPTEHCAVPDQDHPPRYDCIPGSVLAEQMLSLSKAARRLPSLRGGKPPHPATLYRWATAGRKSRSGRTVHLEIWRVGGTNCTSIEAIARFLDALNDIPPAELVTASQPKPPMTGRSPRTDSHGQARESIEVLRVRGLMD